MTAKIQNNDSYYQTFIKNGLHILPYAFAIIFIIQLAIQKIKLYLSAQWNQFIGYIILLLNCTIEDEIENSLNSHEGAHRKSINADGYNISHFNTNNMNKVGSGLDSSSKATNFISDFDDSVSDIEILRGDDDDETKTPKFGTIAEEIAAKTVILKKKRHELCDQLLAYKLMEFQIEVPFPNASSSPNVPKPKSLQSKSKSPLPVAEEINLKIPSPPASPKAPPFIPEYEQMYGLTCEEMLARAIQASIDDIAAKETLHSNLTPPREDSSFAKLPGESSAESRRGISTGSPRSPGKIRQRQSTPSKFTDFLDMFNKNYSQDVEKEAEEPETRQKDGDNVVMEDFMEGDRYVGDKGKRPLSGRYAYKKRSKPSKSEEPGASGSGDLPKDSPTE